MTLASLVVVIVNDVPEGEYHQMDPWCECRPEVVRVERDTNGVLSEVQVVHRSAGVELVEATTVGEAMRGQRSFIEAPRT